MKRVYTSPGRSEKVGVNVTPELLDQLQILANIDGVNYSYKAYQIIQQYVDNHQQQIQQYKKLIGQMDQQRKKLMDQIRGE